MKDDNASAVVAGSPRVGPVRKVERWLAIPTLIAALGAISLAGYGTWRYESPAAAGLAVRGYALAVTPATTYLPEMTALQSRAVLVPVRNLREIPVAIVGCRPTCRCTSVPKLPLTIAPGQTAEIEAALYASIQDVGKPLSGQILLYLDVPSPPVVLAFSVGNVLEPTDERTVKH